MRAWQADTMDNVAKHVLIAWHSRTGGSAALAKACAEGAGRGGRIMAVDAVQPEHLIAASAYIFVAPENLATLSGAAKEMFDRCYYPCLGRLEGRAYASIICAGSDGEGAGRQLDRIALGWRLRRVADAVIVNMAAQTPEQILAPKIIPAERLAEARDLGAAMAEGVAQGIF